MENSYDHNIDYTPSLQYDNSVPFDIWNKEREEIFAKKG